MEANIADKTIWTEEDLVILREMNSLAVGIDCSASLRLFT